MDGGVVVSRDDDRTTDDDADTPRCEHAREQSGEIEIPELPSRRAKTVPAMPAVESRSKLRYQQPSRERDREGYTDHRKTPLELQAIPEPSGPENEITPTPVDMSEDARRVWNHVQNAELRIANLIAALEHKIATAQPVEPSGDKSGGTKKKAEGLERILWSVAGLIVAFVAHRAEAAISKFDEMRDHDLIVEQRLVAVERTLGAIVVPRLDPRLLQPGAPPGKDTP